ncbi:ASCH domain-containing protein [Aquitalea sp. S1-19]|nr:ASCH domain-containing protein [Aquitalea sp. S1-19]
MNRKFTFFSRFIPDILAGRKTITIRDDSESWPKPGELLEVHTFEDDRWFCQLRVLEISPLALADFNEEHAQQENMSLPELRQVIADIYPGQDAFWPIRFEVTAQ